MNEIEYRAAERRLWDSIGRTPTESFVQTPRLGVRVRVQEIGEGPPVLFIHGGPNAGSTWAPLVEHLDGYRCLLVDRPGTGLSDPYTVTADNLEHFGDVCVGDVLDALGIERAHVVASSFGGMLALRSAAAEPGRIERMVQMAAPALAPNSLTPPFMRAMSIGLVRRVLGMLPPNERATHSIMRQIGHGATLDAGTIPQVFWDWYEALQTHTETMENDGSMIGWLCSVRGFRREYEISTDVLGAVTTPTLFLWGADDGFGGVDVAHGVIDPMPNAELVMIPDAGHLPWLDDPAGITAATAAFLAGETQTPAIRSERAEG